MEKTCLNCHQVTGTNYCPNCGQRSGMHRITFKHFLMHDVLHGLWHLERGILFTLKEAMVRPGQAALDYIAGKRVRYYNVFYLSLLVLALNILLNSLYDRLLSGTPSNENQELALFVSRYVKLLLLGIVPILAVSGRVVFLRLRLNLAEHMIIGGMALLGILVWAVPFYFVIFAEKYFTDAISILKIIFALPLVFYPAFVYINASGRLYGFLGLAWRTLIFLTIVILMLMMVTAVIAYLVTGNSHLKISI